jgi:glycosyltransferase involved in cell wall biosynthesis
MPLVSVIMPVHQAAAFLHEGVASVQAQTLPDWELCAVEDGSTDDSWAVLQALAAADPRIRPHRMAARGGPGPARNAGLAAARGRYMAFLDADDLWHPTKLERQVGWMQAKGHVLTATGFQRSAMQGPPGPPIGVPALITRAEMLKTNLMACSCVAYDRQVFGLRAMPAIPRRQDFAFWLSLLQDHDGHGLPEVLATIRSRAGSVSSGKLRAARATWAMYRDTVGLTLPATATAFASYAWRGLWRRAAPGAARRLGYVHPAHPPGTLLLD